METNNLKAGCTKRLGFLSRFCAALASVNAERLAQCPQDDRQAVARTGIAILCAFIFMTIVLTGAMDVAFGGLNPVLVPIAGLMAGMVILIDHAIIQSHWLQSGLSDVSARGFDPNGPKLPSMIRRVWVVAFRFLLSFAIAFTLAGFVDLLIYDRDIQRQMAADHQAQNAAVIARAKKAVEAEIERATAEIARLDSLVDATRSRATAADELAAADLIARRTNTAGRLKSLRDELTALETDVRHNKLDAIAEDYGIKDNPAHSGVKGKGERFKAAEAKAALAERRIGEINMEIAKLEAASESEQAPAASALAVAKPDLMALADERTHALAKRDTLVAGRERQVLAIMTANPDFAPLEDGLVLRLTAMMKLMEEPSVWIKVWGLKLVIMMIEMGGLLTKFLLVRPSLYAVRTVADFEVEAADVVAEASARLAKSYGSTAEANERRDQLRERYDRDSRRRRTAVQVRTLYDDEFGQEFEWPRQIHQTAAARHGIFHAAQSQ